MEKIPEALRSAELLYRCAVGSPGYGDVDADELYRNIHAALTQQPESEPETNLAGELAVPEGWRLVPETPTSEMILAAKNTDTNGTCYLTMLAAAPSVAKGEKREWISCEERLPSDDQSDELFFVKTRSCGLIEIEAWFGSHIVADYTDEHPQVIEYMATGLRRPEISKPQP